MPTVTQNEIEVLLEASRIGLSAYNFFAVTDAEQAPLTGLTALRNLFVARTGPDQVYLLEQQKYIEDWDFAIVVLGLVDTDVSGSDTAAAMQAVFTAFNANMALTYLSQTHHVR